MPLKKGDTARQVMPAPIQGTVEDAHYDAETGKFRYLIQYANDDGAAASRWFDEAEIQEVKE